MILVTLDTSIFDQVIANSSLQSNIDEDKSLYSHSKVFEVTEIPKNVAIFKYHCTINLTLSTVNDMVSHIQIIY